MARELPRDAPEAVCRVRAVLARHPIWVRRNTGIGVITQRATRLADAITGPNLRAAGIAHDLRKAKNPYLPYDKIEFDIPVGENGDCYDRYLVRMKEMVESARLRAKRSICSPSGRLPSAGQARPAAAEPAPGVDGGRHPPLQALHGGAARPAG